MDGEAERRSTENANLHGYFSRVGSKMRMQVACLKSFDPNEHARGLGNANQVVEEPPIGLAGHSKGQAQGRKHFQRRA
jgi:hypothetical protein